MFYTHTIRVEISESESMLIENVKDINRSLIKDSPPTIMFTPSFNKNYSSQKQLNFGEES